MTYQACLFEDNAYHFQDDNNIWWKLHNARDYAEFRDVLKQWHKPEHGKFQKYFCGEHQCYSNSCAWMHGCEASHEVVVTAEAFRCGKCGYKGKLDLSRIPGYIKDEIERIKNSGEPLKMCSIDGVRMKRYPHARTKPFYIFDDWVHLPLTD